MLNKYYQYFSKDELISRIKQLKQKKFRLIWKDKSDDLAEYHILSGNDKGNLLSELKKEKYVSHLINCSPRDLLTPIQVIDALTKFLTQFIYPTPQSDSL